MGRFFTRGSMEYEFPTFTFNYYRRRFAYRGSDDAATYRHRQERSRPTEANEAKIAL